MDDVTRPEVVNIVVRECPEKPNIVDHTTNVVACGCYINVSVIICFDHPVELHTVWLADSVS